MLLSPDVPKLLDEFIADSPAMIRVLARVAWYARAHTPVVLVGAPGTGKTTLAAVIHAASGRRGPFTAHTAREFDPHLERTQLFGHEAGAFTGAHGRHIGIFEEAADGTLLLDDFHHLRRSTQLLLLRALGSAAFRRVGGSRDLPVRCRLLIGLTQFPGVLLRQRTLLAELRARIGYSTIRLPRLEERREDIPRLAQRFLERCSEETGKPGPVHLAPEVVSTLEGARWRFNVRDLAMVIREGYLRAERSDVLRLEHVSPLLTWPQRFRCRGDAAANARAIRGALEATHGDIGAVAALVRASRSTVYHYLSAPGRPSASPGAAGQLDKGRRPARSRWTA